jgi:plastocyanin
MVIRLPAAAVVAFSMGAIVAVQAANTITVVQRGLLLNQKSATLTRGDRIIFTNEDDVIHNIHIFAAGDEDVKDLGLQKPGATLAYTFDKAGNYKVRCNIHPSVKMTVTVN